MKCHIHGIEMEAGNLIASYFVCPECDKPASPPPSLDRSGSQPGKEEELDRVVGTFKYDNKSDTETYTRNPNFMKPKSQPQQPVPGKEDTPEELADKFVEHTDITDRKECWLAGYRFAQESNPQPHEQGKEEEKFHSEDSEEFKRGVRFGYRKAANEYPEWSEAQHWQEQIDKLTTELAALKSKPDQPTPENVKMDWEQFKTMTPEQQKTWMEYLSKHPHKVGTI